MENKAEFPNILHRHSFFPCPPKNWRDSSGPPENGRIRPEAKRITPEANEEKLARAFGLARQGQVCAKAALRVQQSLVSPVFWGNLRDESAGCWQPLERANSQCRSINLPLPPCPLDLRSALQDAGKFCSVILDNPGIASVLPNTLRQLVSLFFLDSPCLQE